VGATRYQGDLGVIRFPYEAVLARGTRAGSYETTYRPMIPLRLFGPIGEYELGGLVDTGSDDTLFPDHFIRTLGVVIPPSDYAAIAGIDGSMPLAPYGKVDLAIPGAGGGHRWSARVDFHPGHRVALGYSGFLEYFTASFNGRGRHLTLTLNGKAPPTQLR
jgi:hypothetical protein